MPKSEDNQDKPRTFKIIAGSYEKLLYGLEGTILLHPDEEYTFDLNPIFIFPAHVSCIKAVAASPMGGKWLATGSGDEIVKVWDLRRKKEVGGLMHHEGNYFVLPHLFFPWLNFDNLQVRLRTYLSLPVRIFSPPQKTAPFASSVQGTGRYYAHSKAIKGE